jgi:RNA polymerase sigma-70 factor, ECF subfamily
MIVLVLPDIPQEDQLLAQARQGDQDAIMRIYDDYFPAIFSFIRLRVDDPHVAEDLASEVFLRLVAAIQNRTAPRHSLRGWLFRVARNLLYDHYGQVKRFPTTTLDDWLPDDANLESQISQSMDRDHARRAIRMLADDQQEVLLLRFGQGLSLQETADIMGRNVGAVKSLQFRAVSTLRQVLGQA